MDAEGEIWQDAWMERLGAMMASTLVAGMLALPLAAGSPALAASVSGPTCRTAITQADSGRTVSLKLGACAQLELSGLVWSTPTVSGTSVRLRKAGKAYVVTTVRSGRSTITSLGRPRCEPDMACPTLVVLFRVTIDVVPRSA